MKIINQFYLLTIGVILLGLPTLLYIKLNQPAVYTYQIAIYGDTIDASMLAYHIDKNIKFYGLQKSKVVNFNITLISPPKAGEEEEEREEIDKEVVSFCGVETEWMRFLEDSKLKYYIKEYGVYFGQTMINSQKNEFSIYSVESNFLKSLTEYGLSNYAAQNFFLKFAQNINKTSKAPLKYRLEDLSISRIIRKVFPSDIANGLNYFSEKLGLDQNYIQQFILPVIVGNYFHDAHSLSTLYKLLPVYCHRRPEIGESLVLFEYPHKIKEKILMEVTHAKLNFINNKRLQTYSISKDPKNDRKKYVNVILTKKSPFSEQQTELVVSNQTSRTYIKSDIFFIFQNIDSTSSGKQFSYYKTIIDGKIMNDHLYEEFFTIYLKYTPKKKEDAKNEEAKKEKVDAKLGVRYSYNPIYSITRICAYNCKGYQNSAYMLISKHKLSSSKALNMFQSHNIINYKKYYKQQSQLPTNKQLQENQNVFKIYDIDSISDSYELQLKLVSEISQAFMAKIKKEYLL